MSKSDFTDLKRHVDDPERRRRLSEIEASLTEHEFLWRGAKIERSTGVSV